MPILNWLNKDQAVNTAKNCAYRLLEEVPELSYGDKDNENQNKQKAPSAPSEAGARSKSEILLHSKV